MKIKTTKVRIFLGIVFSVLGLALAISALIHAEYSYQLLSYFSPEYLSQFVPPIIGILFFLSGFYLLRSHAKTNLLLALFGHSATEELIFSWIGLKATQLPGYSVWVVFILALLALYLGYSNTFNFNKLSYKDAVYGILTGIVVSLLPGFLGAYRLY